MRLEKAFTDTITTRYAAAPRVIDFANDEGARASINEWVEEQTSGHIRGLIPSGVLGPSTRLVLCDAIYCRGAWKDSFAHAATANGPFHLRDSDDVIVPFMHATQVRRCAENHSVQVLELPYRGGSLALLVILPRDLNGLRTLEQELDPDSLAAWDARLEGALVQMALPKFQIEGEFRLASALTAMGMRDAFTEGADFSGIARERSLFMSEAFHKAFVTVDEHGTEVATVTAGVFAKGDTSEPKRQVTFTANHPFLFLIRERPSGTILFMGRLADPS